MARTAWSSAQARIRSQLPGHTCTHLAHEEQFISEHGRCHRQISAPLRREFGPFSDYNVQGPVMTMRRRMQSASPNAERIPDCMIAQL